MPFRSRNSRRFVLVASHRTARLFEMTVNEAFDRCELAELAVLRNTLQMHDRGKPAAAGPRGVDFANADREHDVMRDQFAAEVIRWFEHQAREQRIDEVHVLANPEFLGALRRARSATSRVQWHETQADLAHLERSALARHRVIRALSPVVAQ